MMKFACIFFLVGSCGLIEGMIKEYVYSAGVRDWLSAQWYCRNYYHDLATFSTAEEQKRIVEIFGQSNDPVWIGLYRIPYYNWQWSDGEPVTFSAWCPGFPATEWYSSNWQYHLFTYLDHGQWKNSHWGTGHPSYCYRYLILVNESKTWEEALQYCTTNYTGLASLPNATQVIQAKTEIALTQTVRVWTALHFMDGKWFWLSGEAPENLDLLPSCPTQPYRCGAFNNNTNTWENRDCKEKLNFLCYWK